MTLGHAVEKVLDVGSRKGDDIQRVRLLRQVNGLNLFFMAVALSVGVFIVLFAPGSLYLYIVQFSALVLYAASFILTIRGGVRFSRLLTLHVFEWHLFFGNVLMNVWSSPAIFIITLYPLMAALVETSIARHLLVGVLQAAILAVVHFGFPSVERDILALSHLGDSAVNAILLMSLALIPVMAAVIISIIYRENVLAREKTRRMLNEITIANRELENFAVALKDETQRLRAEVDIARRIQTMVLPSDEEIKAIGDLDIACIMRPAEEVGGDYYDVIRIGGTLTLAIGDVTGHGLTSGLIMLMAQTAVRTIAESGVSDPVRFIELLNRTLRANIGRIRGSHNMTFALVSCRDGTYAVSGQHESLVVCRAEGSVEVHDTQELGFYLGMLPEVADTVKTLELRLSKGDILALYTDGITEADNEKGEQYGMDRIVGTLRASRGLSADRIKDRVMKDLYNFIGDAPLQDDVSLMVIKQR